MESEGSVVKAHLSDLVMFDFGALLSIVGSHLSGDCLTTSYGPFDD